MLIDSTAPEDDKLDHLLNELEWRRDHSHVRSLKRSEWQRMLIEAGLELEQAEDFPKRHIFADWTARSRMDDEDRLELEKWLLDSTPEFQQQFTLEIENDRVIAFTDRKTLFKCRKH